MDQNARIRASVVVSLLFSAGVLLSVPPTLAQQAPGTLVIDSRSGVSITFSGEPQAQEEALTDTDTTIRHYFVVEGELVAILSVSEMGELAGDVDLDAGVTESAQAMDGTLVSVASVEHQGRAGRDFEIAMTDPATSMKIAVLSRLVWTSGHVVQLRVVGRAADHVRLAESFAGLVRTLDLDPRPPGTIAADEVAVASGAPDPTASPAPTPIKVRAIAFGDGVRRAGGDVLLTGRGDRHRTKERVAWRVKLPRLDPDTRLRLTVTRRSDRRVVHRVDGTVGDAVVLYGRFPRFARPGRYTVRIAADGQLFATDQFSIEAPPTPRPTRRPRRANCDPAYPSVCIPPGPPDLDCGDIPYRRFRVIGHDPHRFDADHDGLGCESG